MPDYGTRHKKLRVKVKREVDAGHAYCWRCGRHIPPGSDFHLGHDDDDPNAYMGAEHPACNLATARHKADRQAANVVDTSREW